jgi:hypothetical protein
MIQNIKPLSRRTVVEMGKPKEEAHRNVEKVSRKESSGKKLESPAGSGEGVAEVRKSDNNPERTADAPTISVLFPEGEISLPIASELAKTLGLGDVQVTPEQLSLPVYGNYCGFGHGDPTGNTPPIDMVDAVCREHDLCYGLLGDFDKQCDRHFIESMPSAIASTSSPIGKKAGLLALLYFSLAEQNLGLGETLLKRT